MQSGKEAICQFPVRGIPTPFGSKHKRGSWGVGLSSAIRLHVRFVNQGLGRRNHNSITLAGIQNRNDIFPPLGPAKSLCCFDGSPFAGLES